MTRSFDVFFDLRLNERLSKQPWGWWFETPAWSLWRHRNVDCVNSWIAGVLCAWWFIKYPELWIMKTGFLFVGIVITFQSYIIMGSDVHHFHKYFTFTLYMSSNLNISKIIVIHYCDVIMDAMASQITSLAIVYSTLYSCVAQRKHQSSASLAFVRGIHRWQVNSPHKWPVTRKMFSFDNVIVLNLTAVSSRGRIDYKSSLI